MKYNFFGEPIFEATEAEQVLDQLCAVPDELIADLCFMDETADQGFSLEIKDAETGETRAHVHDLPSKQAAIDFLETAGIESWEDMTDA